MTGCISIWVKNLANAANVAGVGGEGATLGGGHRPDFKVASLRLLRLLFVPSVWTYLFYRDSCWTLTWKHGQNIQHKMSSYLIFSFHANCYVGLPFLS